MPKEPRSTMRRKPVSLKRSKPHSAADVVVLALGESGMMSGEAGSRAYLDLPGNQQQFLRPFPQLESRSFCSCFPAVPWSLTGLPNTSRQSWKSGFQAPKPETPSRTFSTEMFRRAENCQ